MSSALSPPLKPWQTVVRCDDGVWIPLYSSRKGPPSYYRRGHTTLRAAIMWLKRVVEREYLVWSCDGGEHTLTGPTEAWTGFINWNEGDFVTGAQGTVLTWLNLPTTERGLREGWA